MSEEQTNNTPKRAVARQFIQVTDERGCAEIIRVADIKDIHEDLGTPCINSIIVTNDYKYPARERPDQIYDLIYQDDIEED